MFKIYPQQVSLVFQSLKALNFFINEKIKNDRF